MRYTFICIGCGKELTAAATTTAAAAKKIKWTKTAGGYKCDTCHKPKGRPHIPANPVKVDGVKFDSGDEYDYYVLLQKRVQRGEIRDLSVHPKFEIQGAFVDKWKRKYRAVSLTMDFMYTEVATGIVWVDDVKGWKGNDRGKALLPIVQRMYPHLRFRWCDKKGNDWLSPEQKKRLKKKGLPRQRPKLL
jgi:hypothetical protein